MSGPKRNPDSLNTIGVVVVGICGAVMVYVTITALQAFYMSDTSEVQTMADYGGQDTTAKSHKAAEIDHISQTDDKHISIDKAMEQVIAAPDKSALLGSNCTQTHPTVVPQPGAVVADTTLVGGCKGGKAPAAPATAPAAPAAGNGSAATPGQAAAPGNGSGQGSAVPPAATPTATGVTPAGVQGGGGAGASPSKGNNNPAQKLAPGGHAP